MVPQLLKIVLNVLLFAQLLDFLEEEVELDFGAMHQVPSFQVLHEFVQVAHF